MRAPIAICESDRVRDPNTMRIWSVYLRFRGWPKLAKVTRFRNWNCIIWGNVTGIELDVGKFHLEFVRRSGNA